MVAQTSGKKCQNLRSPSLGIVFSQSNRQNLPYYIYTVIYAVPHYSSFTLVYNRGSALVATKELLNSILAPTA